MRNDPDRRIWATHPCSRPTEGAANSQGFGRIDLLVTLLLFGLVGTLLSASISTQRSRADALLCQSNLQQLVRAWQLYTDAHDGILPSSSRNLTLSPSPWIPEWSGLTGGDPLVPGGGGSPGWLDLPIRTEGNINPSLSVHHSPLAPYLSVGDRVWRCPTDRSVGRIDGFREGQYTPRVRTYSMNVWMGRNGGWPNSGFDWRIFSNVSEIVAPSPASAFLIADEREDSINDGSLIVDMSGHEPETQSPPARPSNQSLGRAARIVDYPSHYHGNAGNVGFVDGHVESKRWIDSRTLPTVVPGQEIVLNVPSPGNPDVFWLQERATSRTSD